MSINIRLDKALSPPVKAPFMRALWLSGGYLVFCSLYIFLSGRFAANIAETTTDLKHLEMIKGIAFIFITSLLLFGVQLQQLRAIRDKELAIMDRERALVLTERRAVAAMSTACLAHDLNNMLMVFTGLLHEMKSASGDPGRTRELLQAAEQSMESLSRFSQRISASATELYPESEHIPVRFAAECERLLEIARCHPDVRKCELEKDLDADFEVEVNPVLFEESLLNLVINAAQAAGKAGRVNVCLSTANREKALEVHDSGPGVDPEEVERIFQPCYTTKENGTGLGLMAIKAMSASCGARVEVKKSPLGGALFRLIWN